MIQPRLKSLQPRHHTRRPLNPTATRTLKIPAIVHNEALNGVVSPGFTAFPSPIGLAATWDPAAVEDVITGFKQSRRFAILLVEQGLHFAARLAEKYVVMAKGAVVVAGKSDELSAEMVRQHLTV